MPHLLFTAKLLFMLDLNSSIHSILPCSDEFCEIKT